VAALVGFVGLCLLVGAVGGAVTADAVRLWYPSLIAPPFTPPNWVFAPVWTALYIVIGTTGWLVWLRPGSRPALRAWGWQLAANAAWSPAFFGIRNPGLALFVIAAMLATTGVTLGIFYRRRPLAAWLLLPYLVWTLYAAYLNAGFWWLNRS
jgi:benzodiazapine receptor